MGDPLPEREDWLDPDDVDEADVPGTSEVVVEVSFVGSDERGGADNSGGRELALVCGRSGRDGEGVHVIAN